jgi:hypothetical protein
MRPPRWLRIRPACRTDTPFGGEVQVRASIDEDWGSPPPPAPLDASSAETKPPAGAGLAAALLAAETYLARTEATADAPGAQVDSEDNYAVWRYGESHTALARREARVLDQLAAATEASDSWTAAIALFSGATS